MGSIPDYGLPIVAHKEEAGEAIRIESSSITQVFQTYDCPITHWKYFYARLPIDILDSDDDSDQAAGLQPRYLIFDKVFNLFRHFQANPVLQPSLGRIDENRIKLFDGQHKAAALLWNGHKYLECKVYVDPEIRLLNQTNISAHDRFAQTRFFSSIMVLKLGTQFGADFETYKNLEEGGHKSEAGFVNYIRSNDNLTKGEVNKRFRNFLYNSILEDKDNRLARLVSETNYPTNENPLTINALTNSLFTSFLYREPMDENMATDSYKRGAELQNMVDLMNMLDGLALSQWNPKADTDDEGQRKLVRLIRSRFMKAWSALLKDAICTKLEIYDEDEKVKVFCNDFGENELKRVKFVTSRLVDWKMWDEPADSEIDQIRLDNDGAVKDWLRDKGLTVSYLLGASE